MIPEFAVTKLDNLEDALGAALPDMTVSERDQFTATIRDDFRQMGVDITDPDTAEHVFAGVFVLADAVFSEPLSSPRVAQFTAFLLRNLFVRSEGDSVTEFDLPEIKQNWRTRLIGWLAR